MIKFLTQDLEIAEPMPKGGKIIVRFPFEGDPNTIVDIKPSCGCTADAKVEGQEVVAVFTDTDGPNIDPRHYPSGLMPFGGKQLTVFMEDKEDLYIKEGMSNVINYNKTHTVLNFAGYVKL